MKHFLPVTLIFCAFAAAAWANSSESSQKTTSLFCRRTVDEMTVSIDEDGVFFFETITLAPEAREDNLKKGARNMAFVFMLPILVSDADGKQILFPILKPHIAVSAGCVANIIFKDDHGADVETPAGMTPDGFYRFEIEILDEIPKEITVGVFMFAKRKRNIGRSELLIRLTDDGLGAMFPKANVRLRVMDQLGTQFVFHSDNRELRPDLRGWITADIEKQYIVPMKESAVRP